jgi:hypothetical protein
MMVRPEKTGKVTEDALFRELIAMDLRHGEDFYTQHTFKDERKPTGQRVRWDLYFPMVRGFDRGLVVEVKRQRKPGSTYDKIAIAFMVCANSTRPAFVVLDGKKHLYRFYDWGKRIVSGKDDWIASGNLRDVMWEEDFKQWLSDSAHLFEREQGILNGMQGVSAAHQAAKRKSKMFR